MPDIKTALTQALAKAQPSAGIPAEWDDEGGGAAIEDITTKTKEATMPIHFFTTTNNVTRATFDFVLNNPGKTRKEVSRRLAEQGFIKGSTSSLLGQFVKQGQIAERDGFLFAQQSEYTPLKMALRKPAVVAAPVPKVTKPEPAPQIAAFDVAWNAENLLNNLSIKQARALYDELRKIFGG
jgi:hypothetical protein